MANVSLFLLLMLSSFSEGEMRANLYNGMSGKRQTDASLPSLLLPLPRSTLCAAACLRHGDCHAFNWKDSEEKCELVLALNGEWSAISPSEDRGWIYFLSQTAELTPCLTGLCDSSSVCLAYPSADWDDSETRVRYTCSANDFLVEKKKRGMTDCKFSTLDDVFFEGFDIKQFYKVTDTPYYKIMSNCNADDGSYSCLGLLCSSEECYLKSSHHLASAVTMAGEKGFRFWYADCV